MQVLVYIVQFFCLFVWISSEFDSIKISWIFFFLIYFSVAPSNKPHPRIQNDVSSILKLHSKGYLYIYLFNLCGS